MLIRAAVRGRHDVSGHPGSASLPTAPARGAVRLTGAPSSTPCTYRTQPHFGSTPTPSAMLGLTGDPAAAGGSCWLVLSMIDRCQNLASRARPRIVGT